MLLREGRHDGSLQGDPERTQSFPSHPAQAKLSLPLSLKYSLRSITQWLIAAFLWVSRLPFIPSIMTSPLSRLLVSHVSFSLATKVQKQIIAQVILNGVDGKSPGFIAVSSSHFSKWHKSSQLWAAKTQCLVFIRYPKDRQQYFLSPPSAQHPQLSRLLQVYIRCWHLGEVKFRHSKLFTGMQNLHKLHLKYVFLLNSACLGT